MEPVELDCSNEMSGDGRHMRTRPDKSLGDSVVKVAETG